MIENEAIVSDNQKVAESLRKFCVKAVDKLNIKEFRNISNIDGLSDLVEIATKRYQYHPSIIAITEKFNFTLHFEFEEVNLKDIENEILNLNSKRKLLRQASRLKYSKKRLPSAVCVSPDIEWRNFKNLSVSRKF